MKVKSFEFNGIEIQDIERIIVGYPGDVNRFAYYFKFFDQKGNRYHGHVYANNTFEFKWKLSEKMVHGNRNETIHLYGGV